MNWKAYLTHVSGTLQGQEDLIEEFRNSPSGWLGFDPATEEEIEKAEQRLGTILPPSYKEFLLTSNGFKQLSCFVWDILPVGRIEWLRTFEPHLIEIYSYDHLAISDADYFVYGEKQRSEFMRNEYLIDTLAVSGWGDASLILLNPHVKFGKEWEAWVFANWLPGANRYRSFEELMKVEYSGYLNLRKNDSQ